MRHYCKTRDGQPIVIGLRVQDYDAKLGTITAAPYPAELERPGCHSGAESYGHWWIVTRDDGSVKEFDGSRLVTYDTARRTLHQEPKIAARVAALRAAIRRSEIWQADEENNRKDKGQ